MNKRLFLIGLVGLTVLITDQATKFWARKRLLGQPGMSVVSNYLRLDYYENKGMAFSLGQNLPAGRFVLIAVGIIVLVFVWRVVRQVERRQRIADIAFALVAGGAIGNIIDRIWLGRVIDFIVMHWQHRYVWPAYNVADVALCTGVGLLVIAIGSSPSRRVASATTAPRRKGGSQHKRQRGRRS